MDTKATEAVVRPARPANANRRRKKDQSDSQKTTGSKKTTNSAFARTFCRRDGQS